MTVIMSILGKEQINRTYLYHLISEGKRLKLWINKEHTEFWFTPEELEGLAREHPTFNIPEYDKWKLADPAVGVERYDALIKSVEEKLNTFKSKYENYGQGSL